MPAEVQPSSRPRAGVRVAVSPLVELGMALFIVNRAYAGHSDDQRPWVARLLAEHRSLVQELAAGMGDGDGPDCGELMVLAWRAGNLLTQDLDGAWSVLERTASETFAVPDMESEPPDVMAPHPAEADAATRVAGVSTALFRAAQSYVGGDPAGVGGRGPGDRGRHGTFD